MPRSGAALLEAKVVEPLLKVLTDVAEDPAKKAAFDDDPARYLAEHGYEDVDAEALDEAFSLVADTLPPEVAQSVAGPAPAAAPLDHDDGSGGAPDTTINPDEDAFGGVDESFDTAALNGSAGDGGLDTAESAADDGDVADGNGGYGTGELSLGLDAGDTVAFGVGSEAAGGSTVLDADHDGLDDAFELTDASADTTLPDADHDGLDDAFEGDSAVDGSTLADADHDGLDDAFELTDASADTTLPDADHDGLDDAFDDIGSF